jgi:signal transduction histidine kinase
MSFEGDSLSAIDHGLDAANPLIELAHDLRTPLTSILFLSETLRSGMSGPLTPLQAHQLDLIYAAAFELSSLANDVTELGHGGDDLLEPNAVRFSIRTLLQSIHDIVRPLTESREIELRVHDSVADDYRTGHPAALGRVLLNLLTNAIKSTSTGFVEMSAVALGDEGVSFTITDSGEGLSEELFAALREGESSRRMRATRGFASTGLGLHICRRLVAGMGGELKARRAPQRGSTFSFEISLPAAADEREESERRAS